MIVPSAYFEPIESYKSYKNRSFTKHVDKIRNQLRQIKDCSLKGEDKRKLISLINEEVSTTLKAI